MIHLRSFFTKEQEVNTTLVSPEGYAPHEEFESKRTTNFGMVMVIVMVITGLWQGQNVLVSINATLTPPEQLSGCFYSLINESGISIVIERDNSAAYSSYSYQNIYPDSQGSTTMCSYGEIEKKYGIESLYKATSLLVEKRNQLYKERSLIENSLQKEQEKTSSTQSTYNTALIESLSANTESVYSQSSLADILREGEVVKNAYQSQLYAKDREIAPLLEEIKTLVLGQKSSLESVAEEFSARVRWLEFKRFLVTAVLLLPLSLFTFRRYYKAKNERSEYAIIWGGVALIATLLSSQVFFTFAYRILPIGFFEVLFTFFITTLSEFKIVLVLLQWAAFILIPLFFGYVLYKIQKRYYNKEAVTMRALKDGKCPQCSMKIKDHMVHCPSCSFSLRKGCPSCQHSSISYARYCENCGNSFTSNEVKV